MLNAAMHPPSVPPADKTLASTNLPHQMTCTQTEQRPPPPGKHNPSPGPPTACVCRVPLDRGEFIDSCVACVVVVNLIVHTICMFASKQYTELLMMAHGFVLVVVSLTISVIVLILLRTIFAILLSCFPFQFSDDANVVPAAKKNDGSDSDGLYSPLMDDGNKV
jgi:hypothetical protein